MNDKPQSIWTKSRTGPRVSLGFLLILALTALGAAMILAATAESGEPIWDRVPVSKNALFGLVGLTALAAASLLFLLLPTRPRQLVFSLCQRLFNLRMAGRFLFGLACLATLIALFYAVENWRGRRAWDHYVHQQATQGEEMNLAALIPPPIPDDKNFALCPLLKPIIDYEYKTITNIGGSKVPPFSQSVWLDTNGFERIGRLNSYWLANRFSRLGRFENEDAPELKRQKDEVEDARKELNQNTLTNGWINFSAWQSFYRAITDLDGAASNNLPAVDALRVLNYADTDVAELKREASQRPLSRWPIKYNLDNPWSILLPHLSIQKQITQLLQLRAAAYFASGDVERGITDLELGIRLADSSSNEPFLISHLVRLACYDLLLQPLKEGLARRQFSDAQLVRLQDKLQALDLLSSYQFAIRGERSLHGRWIAMTEQKFTEFLRYGGGDFKQPLRFITFYLRFAPDGWIYQNQLTICRRYDDFFLPVVDVRARKVHPDLAQAIPAAGKKAKGPNSILLNAFFSFLENEGFLGKASSWSCKSASSQTQVDQAAIACALERYRLAQGQFPETLDALAPRFMAKLPHDIINGQPLHYRRTADGQFTLYSIGWNQKDDQGTLVLDKDGKVDQEQGDWIWQQPGR